MKKYIIVKASRLSNISYCGPTWDCAGIREMYQPYYLDLELAIKLCDTLARFNTVGFEVNELSE